MESLKQCLSLHNTKPNYMRTGEQIADAVAETMRQIIATDDVTDEVISHYCKLNGVSEAHIRKVATETIYWKSNRQL